MTTKYRMYIDESGSSDRGRLDDPNHRFLSLTGVIIEVAHVRDVVQPEIDALKQRYFGTPVALHRADIINHRGHFSVLKNEPTRSDFDHDLLQHLSDWEYSVVTICIDKKKHSEQPEGLTYEPYQYGLVMLMDRFHHWLRAKDAVGDVMVEARGARDDRSLKQVFRACMESDTTAMQVRARDLRRTFTSRELKIQSKQALEGGLEIADLLAHPSRDEILSEHGFLNKPMAHFASKLIEQVLAPKYYRNNGSVAGYGKSLLPAT